MRKYVVPIVALAGIALLSPQANAVDLIIKSRAIPAGKAGSLPVIVRNAPATGLWGIDAGLTFSNPALTAAADPFTPNNKAVGTTAGFDSAKDAAVSGNTFVGTGAQPNAYFGYVRGATAIPTGSAQTPIGLVKLNVAAGTARNLVVNITTPSYNVKNTGAEAGSTRNGATAATVNASNQVVSENVNLLDALSAAYGAVPMHKVATTIPGDANADGTIGAADLAIAKLYTLSNAGAKTEFRSIVLDVAPANGYVPGSNVSGDTGLGYGDSLVTAADLASLKLRSLNNNPNFPVAE